MNDPEATEGNIYHHRDHTLVGQMNVTALDNETPIKNEVETI